MSEPVRLSSDNESDILITLINWSEKVYKEQGPYATEYFYSKANKTWNCKYFERQFRNRNLSYWRITCDDWLAISIAGTNYEFEISGDHNAFDADLLFLKLALS